MMELHRLGAEYPIEVAVTEGLANKNCYERSPEMCRYVLWLYEEHLAESWRWRDGGRARAVRHLEEKGI